MVPQPKPGSTFQTLIREYNSINPPEDGSSAPSLHKLIAPHLESFNAITEFGDGSGLLDAAVNDLGRRVIFDGKGNANGGRGTKLTYWFEDAQIGKPTVGNNTFSRVRLTYPTECRERLTTYKAPFMIKLCLSTNDGPASKIPLPMGQVPVMVRSNKCNLYQLSAKQLIAKHEEAEEMGGYFIVNGIERIIRLLIVNRRNHPMAIYRPSFGSRGPLYSPYGVQIRSVRPDQTSQTNAIHYLTDGSIIMRLSYKKQEFLIPALLIMKALVDVSDKQIFDSIVQKNSGNTFLTSRVEMLIRSFHQFGSLVTRSACLAYLGSRFHVLLSLPDDATDIANGEEFLRKLILPHLQDKRDKFNMLIFMIQKLYAFVSGECCADNIDATHNHEVMLPGFLYTAYIKEKLEEWLNAFQGLVATDLRRSSETVNFQDQKYIQKVIKKAPSDIGRKLEYFLATGNIVTSTGMDLQQMSGFTIVAEKLNFYRYISHFRCIHRGAFFAEIKTTSVRKLLPESWGFLCPVHTPDGAPCGLLNHLSHTCRVVTVPLDTSKLPSLLQSLGVIPAIPNTSPPAGSLSVLLDGKVLGWCDARLAEKISVQLRYWKVKGEYDVPLELEIGLVPVSNGGQHSGLFLHSCPSRMVRPVKYLATGTLDVVGSFEQVYMDIACLSDDVVPGATTHIELAPTSILSVVANLTPFSDFNQSPRNMYQCQMGKQTMGTPSNVISRRTDNKMYRIQSPQTPVVRPDLHNEFAMDNFPNGTNAVVAVISYTSYDMEDAMIINKSSHERGFGYGTVYKSEIIDLDDYRPRGEPAGSITFGLHADDASKYGHILDQDGLPFIGAKITSGLPLASVIDHNTGRAKLIKFKSHEDGVIDMVRMLGNDTGTAAANKVHIKIRIPRPPVIGDKFSSRHGQKGVCSQKWPLIDMPFSETGIVPDVIINPHAFPSRMTIGMFVESLAGKSGALHGFSQDSTPFKFNEDHTAADYFGEQLRKAGYNYHGNEPMYSGITGTELKADIYIGVVYYQRLRHMVNDKFQVRTTGPVHNLTQQPIKGRKRAGGIRFGEMERDSLLAHGVSYLLQDRLMNCSDYSQTHICKKCGSFLSTVSLPSPLQMHQRTLMCRLCDSSEGVEVVAIPYVFRYLCTELMAMGIRLKLDVK
ncbi:hypothetical protein BKA69DRAFT_1030032 [Paraphysoderma sedebokerense]|nr:hypothetical protein BKA69DRAFT_1030032 [Paraphysoderma sedebokerense]